MSEQRSPEWFKARRGRVTASKVGAILGRCPYRKREEVMRAMVRDHHRAESEFEGNHATAWGIACEEEALGSYELDTGHTVRPAYFETRDEWAGASPDGYLGEDGLLEIKCPFGLRDAEDEEEFKSLEDQPHYYDQMQFQMWVTGRRWCDFYQWAPAAQKLVRVEASEEWVKESIPKLKAFWDEYLVELDNPAHLAPLIKVVESDMAKAMAAEWERLKEQEAALKNKIAGVRKKILDLAGDEDADVSGVKVRRVERRGSVDYKRLLSEVAPDADIEAYRKKGSSYWRVG